MSKQIEAGKMSGADRVKASLLRWSPPILFLLLTLPLPAYFFFRYFTATEAVGEYLILALTSLGLSAAFGLVAAALVVLYRRFWERRLREKLATDGVTASELNLFLSEVSPERRRALKEMEARNPLLADAYRETLAASITAERVLASTRREASAVEQRMRTAAGLQSAGRAELERDLSKDRERLTRVETEAAEHARELDARLHTIEAMAARGASEAETEMALRRLGTARESLPLGMTSVREEFDAREETERELRDEAERAERELQEFPPKALGGE